MSDQGLATAAYESRQEAAEKDPTLVAMWLDAIEASESEEKDWRNDGEKAVKLYRSESDDCAEDFNIFHANIETVCPALYNSTPVPDVRRSFADKDETGKQVADLIERSLSHSVGDYDFDAVMVASVQDMALVDRGVARVRYLPTFAPDGSSVLYEEAKCEHVSWKNFRRGPGRNWSEVPWVAFLHFLGKEELEKLAGKEKAEKVPLNYTTSGKEGKSTGPGGVFKRALVWEIWDKENRQVLFISPEFGEDALSRQEDPLGLVEFFPIPRPLQTILSSDSMVPVVPHKIYKALINELGEVTKRITKLVKQLRPRGGYLSTSPDLKNISEADDGELVPISDPTSTLTGGGGIDKNITWFPLEPTVKALMVLREQREAIKQSIYEVTGVADIMRGQSSASETLGAQQIKAQWGSLRIQKAQKEVERFARDLFRLKAEVIASKFSLSTLTAMTGIPIPTAAEKQVAMQEAGALQQQGQPIPERLQATLNSATAEEVEAILRNDFLMSCKIDVESDSTIRGDLVRSQQAMTQFLSGTAQYASAMAGLVASNPKLIGPTLEVYASFARQFKLGKSTEDALGKLIRDASEPAQPKEPPPDPRAELDKAKLAHEQEALGFKREQLQDQRAEREQARQDQALPEQNELMAAVQTMPAVVHQMMQAVAVLAQSVQGLAEQQSAPREIVRDGGGKAIAIREGNRQREILRGPDDSVIGVQ